MQKNTNKKSGISKSEVFLAGAGLATILTGAYFFLGPNAKKNQKNTKAWAEKMKKDVLTKVKKAKIVSGPLYNEIIDSVGENYLSVLKVSKAEVETLKKDLKKHWGKINKSVSKIKKEVKKTEKK